MSNWGWHAYPGKEIAHYEQLRLKYYQVGDKRVGYMSDDGGQEELFSDLRVNPHRANLIRIGLQFADDDEQTALGNLSHIEQQLDLYHGTIFSSFLYKEERVLVETVCHPELDQISVRIQSKLLKSRKISVLIAFGYGSHAIEGVDYTKIASHQSHIVQEDARCWTIERKMDNLNYNVVVDHEKPCSLQHKEDHQWLLFSEDDVLEASFLLLEKGTMQQADPFGKTREAASHYYRHFWEDSAFIDVTQSSDPRSAELERRILLSRYLLAIQCSGIYPPAETGLTCNSWYGKFHLEMHLLHAAHFAIFGQAHLLERSLSYYQDILEGAYERAKSQGYRGARWPKMTDPSGNDSPSSIGTLLCWQQPHPIFYGALLRRTKPDSPILDSWTEVVRATAQFMVDYVHYDDTLGSYVLGPALIPVQENHDPLTTINPTFELSYWRWALAEAIDFLQEKGEQIDPKWLDVLEHLSPLPTDGEVYLAHQECNDTYGSFAYDHPSLLFCLGLLDTKDVDHAIMSRSLSKVIENWKLNELWGWDFPLMAMTAARLGQKDLALDLLLMDSPKNTYTLNGHNAQLPKADLPLYLPGNGALLLAIALLAGGWEECGQEKNSYSSQDWIFKAEGLKRFW